MDLRIVEEEDRSDNFKKVFRLEVTSQDDFRTAAVRNLYFWWEGFQPALPKREDFDISRHWATAPSLYLIEVVGPGNYIYRLNGEAVVDIVGASLRGHEISATSPLPELRRLADYFDTIVAGGKCRRCTGIVDVSADKARNFESVDCPLADAAGEIRFILGAIALIE
ncbi:PAS domain-containing protein [Sneathiella chungangensis]|uniref:PAS domain-containing protein n=1 Tax=Sneathiella chungangensis TaxID=1418234 RepID=A0A845M8U2_9PROT|nr:PAS domain-containing protein [Sneathiella chungangensis]